MEAAMDIDELPGDFSTNTDFSGMTASYSTPSSLSSGYLSNSPEERADTISYIPPAVPVREYAPTFCCVCGVGMPPNPTRMCVDCVRSEVNITAGVSKSIILLTCKDCKRYYFHKWLVCELESKELLALCLKKIRGINKVKVVDAQFLWTEPHSKRIKIKLTVQKEVINGAIMQETFTVEFIIQSSQCDECKRLWTPHTWNSRVQLRQRAKHKRTLLYLEQLILKHDAHENIINIVEHPDGLDFHFTSRSHSQKLVDFVANYFPTKSKASKELISQDLKNNTYFFKHTIYAEICAICKDDLVWLPRKLASQFGGISPFLLCYHVSTAIHLVDPFTLQSIDVSGDKYWKYPFKPVLTRSNLNEYIVLDADYTSHNEISMPYKVLKGSKYRLATCEIARASDFGYNDERITVRCHIGGLLKPGDWCLGYEMKTIHFADYEEEDIEMMAGRLLFDVILVKRKRKQHTGQRHRAWKLQWLPKTAEVDVDRSESSRLRRGDNAVDDIEDFENELEDDPEMRKTVNLMRNPMFDFSQYQADRENEDVSLEELLEGLTLNNANDVA